MSDESATWPEGGGGGGCTCPYVCVCVCVCLRAVFFRDVKF